MIDRILKFLARAFSGRRAAVLAAATLLAPALLAQVERASVSGIVSDRSGAPVPGAKIEALNLETGVNTATVTNSSGNYYMTLLPGDYRITAAGAAFATSVVPRITLTVGQAATVNVTLQLSSVRQQVTVQDVAPLIDQSSASLSTTIQAEKIEQIPLLGRNPFTLVVLAPGVNPKGNRGTGPLINGGRSNANAVLLDGGQVLNSTTNDASYTPPLESVEEFRVSTSSYQAEYGRTAGGVLNATTKMGTNQFHGVAYEYFRNDALNANTWSNDRVGLEKAVVRHNEFGAALGGPVWLPKVYDGHNRTFFFFNWESVPDRKPQTLISTVPSALQRAGDFSQTFGANGKPIVVYDPLTTAANPATPGQYARAPFAGNQIPSARLDSVARAILNYYPQPNAPGLPVLGTQNYLRNGVASSGNNRFITRIDHALNDRNRLFGRIGINTGDTTSTAVVNEAFPQQTSTAYEPITTLTASAVIGDTVTFRPNLIGEFRAGYLRNHKDSVPTSMGFDLTALGFSSSVAAAARAQIFPGVSITGMSPLGTATTALRRSVQDNRQTQSTITWVTGRHTVKFGADVEIFRNDTYSPSSPAGNFSFSTPYTQGPNPTKASANAGYGLASFLLGLPASGALTMDPSLATQQVYTAGFVQDTFRVTKRLTLDLGLRYDFTTPWQDRFNQLAYFNPSAADAVTGLPGAIQFVSPQQRGQTDPPTRDFGPRAGIAWLVAPRTTFRAGYGIFYAQGNRGVGAVSSELGQGFQTSTSVYLGPPAPVPYLPPVGASFSNPFVTGFVEPPSNLVGASISTVLRDFPNPTQQQWTASLQHQLTASLMIEAAYTGSRGEHIWQDFPLDAANPMYLSMGTASAQLVPNPFYGQISTGALSAKTVAASQLLLPYPQYTGINLHNYPIGDSTYHALTLRADRRFSHGFTVLVSYTASKEIDDVGEHFSGRTGISDPYNLRLNRSVADYDVPQRLVVSYVYQMPFGPGQAHFSSGLASRIVGSWQISGITSVQKGMPLVITGPNTSGLPGLTSRAARLHSGVLSTGQTTDHWFDTAAFTAASPFTLGTDSRTEPNLRAPGIVNFDFALMRNQRLWENSNLEFRAESFNLFNTPQLGAPDSSVTSPTFGRILSGGGNRQLQLGLRLSF